MNATRRDIEAQFQRALRNGWLPLIQKYAKAEGTTTAFKLARGSRETNLNNIRGDFRGGIYHGYGIEQVDIGTDQNYCRNWTPTNVEGGFAGGTRIFLSKIADTRACVGRKVQVKGRWFIGRDVEPDDLRRIAAAAYNCGRWAHYHFSRGENVDSTTTGNDYSRDVYDRAVEFADLLEKHGLEINAVAIELEAQGKYARREHQNRFGHIVIADRLQLPAGDAQDSQDELASVDYERDQASTATYDPAGSNSLSDPAPIAVELGAAGLSGSPVGVTAPGQNAEVTLTQTQENPQGSTSVSATVPAGDPPDAEPSHWFNVEDWKPFAMTWIKRIWAGISGLTLPGGGGLGFAALSDPPHWFIYAAIAVGALIVLIVLGLIVSVPFVVLWLYSHREIGLKKLEQMRIMADPQLKNVGLNIVKV